MRQHTLKAVGAPLDKPTSQFDSQDKWRLVMGWVAGSQSYPLFGLHKIYIFEKKNILKIQH